MILRIKLITTLLFLLFEPALAYEWVDASLGAGVHVDENIRKNNTKDLYDHNPNIRPLPLAFLRFGPWFVNKDGAGMGLAYFENFRLLGVVTYRGEPYKADGYNERKRSFFAGGNLKLFWLQLKYYQDLQGYSHGKIYKFYIAPEWGNEHRGFYFSPRVYQEHWDQRYTDYYFGVREDEVDLSLDRPQYTADEADNFGYEIRIYFSTGRIKWIWAGGQKFYGKSVKESPTVARDNGLMTLFGLLYKFY